ncbi:hypothetical protein Tco_0831049 [Tanacetum coccineum]
MTRSSTKELFTPFEELERVFHSTRRLFKTTSLDYSSLLEFDLFSDPENQSEEEIAEAIGTNGEEAIEHIENFLEIVDSLNIPNVSNNQLRVRVFPFSLTGAASKWWEDESIGVPWVNENPWTDDGAWNEPIDNIHHECNPLRFKNGTTKWPTCNWKGDGYYNTRDLPGFIREGNSIRYEDYEWYDMIKDSELKEEALINKRILEESMNAMDESSDNKWDHDSPIDEWKDYEHTTYIRTDASSNQNTYNNVCQIVMNHCKLKRNKDGLMNTSLWEMTIMTSVI